MGNKIEAAMLKAQPPLNQTSLAELLGVSPQAVQQWVKGKTQPKGKRLSVLASVLKIDINSLISDDDEKSQFLENNQKADITNVKDISESIVSLRNDEVELTFFQQIDSASSSGLCEAPEKFSKKLRFAKATLKKLGISAESAACVTVFGNSMEPVLPHGSTVGIDTRNTVIKDGDLYALEQNGEIRVKLIYKIPGGGLRLRSFNNDEWPDENYSRESSEQIKILGRVFWYEVLR